MPSQYAIQHEKFEKDWRSAIRSAYQRMMRGDENAFYLYFLPHGESFKSFSEMDQIPPGYVLVTGERISGFKTLDQLYAWANRMVGTVPYYDPNPRPKAATSSPSRKTRTKTKAIDHVRDILRGMARGPWALYWADREEEKGSSFSGVDIYEAAPEAPAWAKKWARELADKIVLLNTDRRGRRSERPGLDGLYEEAVAEGFAKDGEAFGYYLGMQAVGAGVRWDDDVSGTNLEISVPYDEFYQR